ncbi:hypothetical protein ACLB2K_017364 [Fragaria x ananassa]
MSSGGENSDQVYALGLCRGDVDVVGCGNCIGNMIQSLKHDCPVQKEAIGWYDNCMLRYSKQPMYGHLTTFPAYSMLGTEKISATIEDEFNQKLQGFLGKLSSQAAAGGTNRKYAAGTQNTSDANVTIYGFAQCIPYLSAQDCTKCLNSTLTGIRGEDILAWQLFNIDQTQAETSRVVGTYGYMAPEYVMRGHFSVKSDVYSFGVLVLEIVSGQKNTSFRHDGNLEDLLGYAWNSWKEGTSSNLIDPTLRAGLRPEIVRCIHIGSDTIFLSILLILLIIIVTTQAAIVVPPFLGIVCSNEKGNFTNGSTYQENIKGLLSILLSNSNGTYFYTTSYGFSDTVYGVGLCRPDILQDPCSTCLKNSSHLLTQACPNQKEAAIWNQHCILRYSNRSIYGLLELVPAYSPSKTENISSWDVYELHRELCTPDLSEQDCKMCLDEGLGELQKCCYGMDYGRYANPSCNLMYLVYDFSDPDPFESTPTSSTNTTIISTGKISRTVIIIVVAIFVSLLLLVASIYIYLRVRKTKQKLEDEIRNADAVQFEFASIRVATNNFAEANKLGRGGFGAVYRLTMQRFYAHTIK